MKLLHVRYGLVHFPLAKINIPPQIVTTKTSELQPLTQQKG